MQTLALLALVLAPLAAQAAVDRQSQYCMNADRRVAKAERSYAASCLRPRGCSANSQRRLRRISNRAADRCVALNQIQTLGTHNSYHLEPRPSLMQALLDFTPLFEGIQYSHLPLDQQFESQGIRQIELDVYNDPNGGLFAVRHGLLAVNEDPNSGLPQLDAPGFKMIHLPDIDFETTCLTFVECLQTIKAWSDAHPSHLPIAVLVEAKEDAIPDVFDLGFITPVAIGPSDFDVLDAEIRSVFPEEQLLTPDDVRGTAATLESAILTRGWPALGEVRGRVMFLLDNGGTKRTQYQRGHSSLEGLVLFTNSNPGNPDAAFVKRNDPIDDQSDIQGLVAGGYVVRTRADGDTVQARTGDTTQREAAFTSGAQWISTDYPVRDPRFTSYAVDLPGPYVARCNPYNAPLSCRGIGLEVLP